MRRLTARHPVGIAVAGLLVGAGLAVTTSAPAAAADPVAGGLSASPPDSLLPNQGNSGYDVQHYDVDLTADVALSSTEDAPSTSTLRTATTTIAAVTRGTPLSSYSFDFQGSSSDLAGATLVVDSVTVNGAAASYSRIENTTPDDATTDIHKLIVTPTTPVDGSFTTVVTYHGAPVKHLTPDGVPAGWNNTVDGFTSLGQPVGSMALFPNNNTPRDKATYTFTVDAPSTLRSSDVSNAGGAEHSAAVVSNGELVSKTASPDGSRTTWVWEETEPMASELSLVSVGRYDVYESDIHLELSNRTLHEWSFIDPAISAANQGTTLATRTQMKPVLDFLESKYGPYPGHSVGLLTDVIPGISYALETQDRSYFSSVANASTFTHELMHQWWGDSVSPTDWNDITLNEGPATYAQSQFPFEAGGSTTSTETALYNRWVNAGPTFPAWAVPPAALTSAEDMFGGAVYNKGAMSLEALRTSIGAVDFETLMRDYQATYAGGQISGRRTAAFQAMAEDISGRDLSAFFDAWWYSAGKPPWPAKYTFGVAGPSLIQVNPGQPITYTLFARNTGKVPTAQGDIVLTLDAADLLDDATPGALPGGVELTGTTLTWTAPALAVGADAGAAIGFTVNAGTAGRSLTGTAAATTLGGTCSGCTDSLVIGTPPVSPSAQPTVSPDPPTVGEPLTADTPGWAAGTTFTYQWLLDGTPVQGATEATYVPDGGALGLPISVRVTGSLPGRNAVRWTSTATAATAAATLASQPTPTVLGTPEAGQTLTVDPGVWEPGTVLTFAWVDNVGTVYGNGLTLMLPAAAIGKPISVLVFAAKSGHTSGLTFSAPVVVQAGTQALTPTPTITGAVRVGSPLTVVPGGWDPGTTLSFAWAADGTPIDGATTTSFTPTLDQLGKTLTVAVSGVKGGTPDVVRTSAATVAVTAGAQTLQPTPTIVGTPRVGAPLSVVPGNWDDGVALSYQWTVAGTAVPGATGTSYTPIVGDVGRTVAVQVTGTKTGYDPLTRTSASTAPVAALSLAAGQCTVAVSGKARVGKRLAAVVASCPAGASPGYQWYAGKAAIKGASGATLKLKAKQAGKRIKVVVTVTVPGYLTDTRTSPPTKKVKRR
ncbi:MAG TPA: hypothetical protein DEQ43_04970 [Nocardioides bacterium]|uniref:M1 family aminopeptidase n=1 Tax=uncultured Nocardioides sp. TaxID=198441 RepID=UPI000EDAB67F|nr:M1 family aminopeptidase [uncultured Nocardioides sp.]HCB03592.1 hypothetical protein [Nocardioides sp.]